MTRFTSGLNFFPPVMRRLLFGFVLRACGPRRHQALQISNDDLFESIWWKLQIILILFNRKIFSDNRIQIITRIKYILARFTSGSWNFEGQGVFIKRPSENSGVKSYSTNIHLAGILTRYLHPWLCRSYKLDRKLPLNGGSRREELGARMPGGVSHNIPSFCGN